MSAGERTEAASPKKRGDAARKGDVLRSRDLAAAAGLLVFAGWLTGGPAWAAALRTAVARALTLDPRATFAPGEAAWRLVVAVAPGLALLAAALALAGVATTAATGALGWRGQAFAWRWDRLDPGKGLARMAGAEALGGLLAALAKVVALVAVAGASLWGARDRLPPLALMAPADGTGALAGLLADALPPLLAVAAVAAAVDVAWQRHRREGRLRMSQHELREERREAEGAPERRRAQRERQYQIAHQSMRRAVPEATAVLTNPAHFAVALRYRPEVDAVPVVVARGVDEAARAIRDLAAAHDVPVLAAPPLARALYFTARTGEPVARDLYLAVATVLAWVFDVDRRLAGVPAPAVEVPPDCRFDANGRRAH